MKLALFITANSIVLSAAQALASSSCLLHREARAKFPHERLYRTDGCWHMRTQVEQATPQTPKAEIWYPTLSHNNMLESGPRLIMKQPWLSSEPMHKWPLLIDVDRPFMAWDKRIGE